MNFAFVIAKQELLQTICSDKVGLIFVGVNESDGYFFPLQG